MVLETPLRLIPPDKSVFCQQKALKILRSRKPTIITYWSITFYKVSLSVFRYIYSQCQPGCGKSVYQDD
jgi:hypothetical protein